MLNFLSEQIRECHMHAEHCARQAAVEVEQKLKDDFLEMERRWLMLARSYEFAQLLLDFSDETKRQVKREDASKDVLKQDAPIAYSPQWQ